MTKNLYALFAEPEENPSGAQPEAFNRSTLLFMERLPLAAMLVDGKGNIAFANSAAGLLLKGVKKPFEGGNMGQFGLSGKDVISLLTGKTGAKISKEIADVHSQKKTVALGASVYGGYGLLTLEETAASAKAEEERCFLRNVVDHYPFAVSVQNLKDECCLWNKHAEELFGHTPAEILGKEIYPFLPAVLKDPLEVMDQEVKDSHKARANTHMRFTDASGKEKTLSVSKVPASSPSGEMAYILTVYEDITNRLSEEQETIQTRNLLQAIVDNVPVGLYTRTADRRMTFFNKQSQQIFNEVQPRFVNSPHAKQTREMIDAYHDRELEILRTGKIQEYPDEVYVDRAGNSRLIHMIKVPLTQAGPEPVVLSIVEDVTKRREQERELVRMNKLLQAIVDNAPIGLYARASDGHMLLRNKRCTSMFGAMDADAFSSNGALPHESKEDVASYLGRELSVLTSGKTLDVPEEKYLAADGKNKIFHLIKVPVKDETNNLNFVLTLAEDITEKKEQEVRLAEAHNFRQAVLDNAPLAIYARRVNNKMSFINKKAHEIFPDESEYKEENNFYGKRERAIFAEKKALDMPGEWYTTRRGTKVLLHLIKVPVYDRDGKPFMMLTIAEDITEKKQQEQEIIKARNFLQTVIDNLPLALSVKNHDGKYILWNKKSESLFGAASADVIGKTHYRQDITPEQAEFLSSADQKVFESGKELNVPQELISTANEGVKIMHTVKTPVFLPDGTPDYLLMVSEDITAKTKMEKQIREANDKNTLLVENAREGIVILEDGKIIYSNRAAAHILGFASEEDLQQQVLLDLVSPDHKIFVKERYEAVINNVGDTQASIEVHFIRKDGHRVETEFAAMASRYLGRRIVICFMRDVTSSNRVLRELKTERENFRAAFESAVTPALVMNSKGYITVMNRACRDLFHFRAEDKNFYRNVYMKPALTLAVRRQLRQGKSAHMEYVFDFDKAKNKFPGRIEGEGKIRLDITFEPINRRDAKDGSVEADYVVYLVPQQEVTVPAAPAAPKAPLPPGAPLPPAKPLRHIVKKKQAAGVDASQAAQALRNPLCPPAPPLPAKLMLPNTEPYALCNNLFKITQCNDLFCSLCQLDQQDLIGTEIFGLFDDASALALQEDVQALTANGALDNREYNLRLSNGLETVAVRLSAFKEANGSFLFVLRNLAFHRQIMKILEERSSQLNALLDATDGVVFSIEAQDGSFGRVEQANKFLSKMLEYGHDELVRLQFKDLFVKPGEETPAKTQHWFEDLETQFFKEGRLNFSADVFRKDGSRFNAQVTVVPLDFAGHGAALVVVKDISVQMDKLAQNSQQAQELRSVRQALPGIYLKTDASGMVLEVYSNLNYLTNKQAAQRFVGKVPAEYWPEEVASKELFAIKEALSINITTHFDFTLSEDGHIFSYEATVTPITGREEAVIWIKDVSEKQEQDSRVHELYAISHQPNLSITEWVDKILAFGQRVFKAEVGLVLRFANEAATEMSVVYVTDNDFNIQRYMDFPVEECLADVADDNVSIYPDLGNTSCTRCIHKRKDFAALIAAPICVAGKPAGALCFASRQARRSFEPGAEELIGLMARILSLRIELRQAGKAVSETSQSLTRTLDYMDFPAVMIGLDYHIRSANAAFTQATGCRMPVRMEFFDRFIRNAANSRAAFKEASQNGSAKAFRLRMDLQTEDDSYVTTDWDAFAVKDADGNCEGYALIGVKK